MKKLTSNLTLLSILVISSFCAGPYDTNIQPSLKLDDSLTLHFQDTLFNNEENIWITFDQVIEDSRCPVDVRCFWAGNAKLGFAIVKEENKVPFTLNTHGGRFPRDTTLFGYKITLLDVKPYPHTDSTFTQIDYSAKIIVSK